MNTDLIAEAEEMAADFERAAKDGGDFTPSECLDAFRVLSSLSAALKASREREAKWTEEVPESEGWYWNADAGGQPILLWVVHAGSLGWVAVHKDHNGETTHFHSVEDGLQFYMPANAPASPAALQNNA